MNSAVCPISSGSASRRKGIVDGDPIQDLWRDLCDHPRFAKSRGNAGHANFVTRKFLGPGHGHRGNTGLAGRIIGLPDIAGARDTGNIDDHATPPAFDHVHSGLSCAEKHAPEINCDDLMEVIDGHFLLHFAILRLHQQAITSDASIIDDAIDAAEVLVNVVEQRFDRRLVRHVGRVIVDFSSCSRTQPRRTLEFDMIDVYKRELGALQRNYFRHFLTQSLRGAGDHNRLAF